MQVELKTITPAPESTIVEIARVSSSRKDKTENLTGLIGYLIRNKHWSPFEHASMTVEIETSKAIGIQLIRHRSFTFQEFSQRYAVVEAMEPIELRRQAESNRQSSTDVFDPVIDTGRGWPHGTASGAVSDFIQSSQALYKALLNAGVARECARMVLPMCTQTKIYMTGTIRSWIHFLEIRDDAHAQLEVQLIAKEIKNIFQVELPLISEALGWNKQSIHK